MQRVERQIVIKSDPNWKQIDVLAFDSKNLYNRANYVVRQRFFETTKEVELGTRDHAEWIGYYELDKLAKTESWIEYSKLPAQTAQQVLKLLEKNWKSFFKAIKVFKTNNSVGKPKLPKYKDTTWGRNIVIFTDQQVKLKDKYIHFPKKAKLIPIKTSVDSIKQVRIIPQATCYVVETVYEKEVCNANVDESLFLGIDLGLNNLVTATSNVQGLNPFIVNGRPLKSINQFFNKTKAILQSYIDDKGTSNRILKLTHKRNNLVSNYLHHTSRFVINYCVENNIGTIVIGKNDGWKQQIKLGKKTNQNFVQIPFNKLIQQIEYKAEEVGIKTIVQEESYTSKASFLDNDDIPTYGETKAQGFSFSGKRIGRGLYRTKDGSLINADVNGSLNILKKAIPNLFRDGIEGLGLSPTKVLVGNKS